MENFDNKNENSNTNVTNYAFEFFTADRKGNIKHWNEKCKVIKTFKTHYFVHSMAIAEKAEKLITTTEHGIDIWNINNGNLLLKKINNQTYHVNIALDECIIVSGNQDKTIKIFDLKTGQVQRTLSGHFGSVTSIAMTPLNDKIVSGSADFTLRVWDFISGNVITTLHGHTETVNDIAITPDCNYIISASNDKTIRIWNFFNNFKSKVINVDSKIYSVAVTVVGDKIVYGCYDGSIHIYNLFKDELEITLFGHKAAVNSIAISPDQQHILSGSSDKTVKVWNLGGYYLEKTIDAHNESVCSVAIRPFVHN